MCAVPSHLPLRGIVLRCGAATRPFRFGAAHIPPVSSRDVAPAATRAPLGAIQPPPRDRHPYGGIEVNFDTCLIDTGASCPLCVPREPHPGCALHDQDACATRRLPEGQARLSRWAAQRPAACQIDPGRDQHDCHPPYVARPFSKQRYREECCKRGHQSSKRRGA